jgi:sRNA-binding carbon storage regulator CsrA
MALSLDLRVGDAVSIDSGRITITLREKSGSRARVSVEAPRDMKVTKVTGITPPYVVARRGLAATK